MKFLLLLLIPIGFTLFIISLKHMLRYVSTEIVYEMPCTEQEGTFTLTKKGKYSVWLMDKQFIRVTLGALSLSIINQKTGKHIPQSGCLSLEVNGFGTTRNVLFCFQAEEGTYILSINNKREPKGVVNNLITATLGPVDYSKFSLQVRPYVSVIVFALSMLGLMIGAGCMLVGIIIPFATQVS